MSKKPDASTTAERSAFGAGALAGGASFLGRLFGKERGRAESRPAPPAQASFLAAPAAAKEPTQGASPHHASLMGRFMLAEEAVRINPDLADAWRALAQEARLCANMPRALQALQRLEQMEADETALVFILIEQGEALQMMGDHAAALKAYWRAAELGGQVGASRPYDEGRARALTLCMRRIGDCLWAEERHGAALDVYMRMIEGLRIRAASGEGGAALAGELAVALEHLGDMRKAVGDMKGAREAYAEVLEATPTAPEPQRRALSSRAQLLNKLGAIAEAQGDAEAARAAYAEIFRIQTNRLRVGASHA